MLDESLKNYWTLVSTARKSPTTEVFYQISKQAQEHPNGKVRTLLQTFITTKKKGFTDHVNKQQLHTPSA